MIETNIIACPCCIEGACLETKTEYVILWSCQTCGYQTNSRMKMGTDNVLKHHSTLPNLMQDLKKEANDLVWYPSVVNMEKKGMVFPDGKNIEEWKWTSVLAEKVPEEEKNNFKGVEYRMNMTTAKQFEPLCFMDALEHIDFYKP
jgi:hypothetical protein